MAQNDEPYMDLVVYSSILIMDISSIFMISKLLWHFSRNETKNGLIRTYSPLLIATLICYGLYSSSSIPACVYILWTWSLTESHRVTRTTFFVMVVPITVCAIISTTVFFLGLEKTLSILFPTKHRTYFKKLLFRLYLLSVALVGLWVALSWVVAHFFSGPNPEGCKSIGCTADSGTNRWQLTKMTLGAANCCIGAYFLYLWRFKHRLTSCSQRAAKMNNLMTVFAFLAELLLNVLPWVVPLIVKELTQFDLVRKFGGGYSFVLSSLESFFFSHIYAFVFLRQQQDKRNHVTIETIATTVVNRNYVSASYTQGW
ncbi:hypothetical protein DdX_15546 [Ditylenchus destructor]|uniref:Uncharacterized protein n=1 Tax=Ditylenchus destructor TaxID=166010 RepID=A0AAD4R0X4_9BILA|nr:hypothetical protein DdX_15546 [Ditylenchus destructor]